MTTKLKNFSYSSSLTACPRLSLYSFSRAGWFCMSRRTRSFLLNVNIRRMRSAIRLSSGTSTPTSLSSGTGKTPSPLR